MTRAERSSEIPLSKIRPVILAGGAGTRLWPLSRPELPKQFLCLAGEESLLLATARRVSDGERYAAPIFVASERHGAVLDQQLRRAGVEPHLTMWEPAGRSTAPAIALAAFAARPDEILLVLPSDHAISKEDAFHAAVAEARTSAEQGRLVTFGQAPLSAETAYGYVEIGEWMGNSTYRVESFHEKPEPAAAKSFVASGRHLWNTGMFLFRADAFLAALADCAPDIFAAVQTAFVAGRWAEGDFFPEERQFFSIRPASVDYAVMEHASNLAVVSGSFGWSDLGGWDALNSLLEPDGAGNRLVGEVLVSDVRGCSIRSTGPVIAASGIRDLIIVATGDGILIARKDDPGGAAELISRRTATPTVPSQGLAEPSTDEDISEDKVIDAR